MQRIVASFDCKSDGTNINQITSPKLALDPSRQHYLSLISLTYSNVFMNMTEEYVGKINLNFNGLGKLIDLKFKPGIYEIQTIMDALNAQMDIASFADPNGVDPTVKGMVMEFRLDLTKGRVIIVPNLELFSQFNGTVLFYNNIPNHIFNSNFLEIRYPTVLSWVQSNSIPEIIEGTSQPSVSTYNKLSLSTNVINFDSYQTDGEYLTIKNQLYSFPANSSAYEFAHYTSVQPLIYSLPPGCRSIDRLTFDLRDEENKELPIVPGSKSDFSVYVQILMDVN